MNLLEELKLAGLPLPISEFAFAESVGRKWRFDYAWPERFIALEVEGGVWMDGRHVRGSGFIGDMAKYNCAAMMGWCVIRITPAQLNNGTAFRFVNGAMLGIVTAEMFPTKGRGVRKAKPKGKVARVRNAPSQQQGKG